MRTTLGQCPPENTMKGWGVKSLLGGVPTRAGRPGLLTAKEEHVLVLVVKEVRQGGGCIDRETLATLGQEVAKQYRGPEAVQVELSKDWVKAFRKRHNMGRLRRSTSDRPRSTPEDLKEDNLWRAHYESIVKEPWAFGLGGLEEPIHPALQLAADETPVMYMPEVRGTYEFKNTKQIQLTGSRERRMITGTPITNRQGELVLMQLLWKGKTHQVCCCALFFLPIRFP